MGLMNKQTDLIDEVYKSYKQSILESFDRLSNDPVIDAMPPRILSQEEFINKIKTDEKYSEKWGLKIDERELSLEERLDYGVDILGYMGMVDFGDHQTNDLLDFMDKYNIPTKLTTINYNGQIQESYE